jgi:hypothetical protein
VGRKTLLPIALEKEFLHWVVQYRSHLLHVFKKDFLVHVAERIADTPYADAFPNGFPTESWYRGWRQRHDVDRAKKVNRIEQSRAEWATPKNLETHYDMLADVIVETGIGEKTETYDPDYTLDTSKKAHKYQPAAEKIRILHPGRILSYDETSCTVDMTDTGGRTLVGGEDDDGVCLAAKSSAKCTAVGGSFADGTSLPPMFVFPVEVHALTLTQNRNALARRRTCWVSDCQSTPPVVSACEGSDGI